MLSTERIACLFGAIILLAACFGISGQVPSAAMSSSEETVTVTDKDNGGQVSVAKGGTLVIRLEAIPGTGYGWQVVKDDTERLELLGKPEFEQSGRDLAGASEQQIFRFRALALGLSQLELHYVRSWEKDVPSAKTFKVKVLIR